MYRVRFIKSILIGGLLLEGLVPLVTNAVTVQVSTTTLMISICGDSIVNSGEECDIPGEIGAYSTTIAGRQCNAACVYGSYCGDGILQTTQGEECDDGNNTSGDFCAANCKIENSGGGGGSSNGSGGGSSGGAETKKLGDTQVSITGKGYPNTTVNILQDGSVIGTVRANGTADFSFAANAQPGTITYGFWATDSRGVRSTTLNTTFDVTQGAITTISGILLPPTISVPNASVNRGDQLTFSGKAAPNVEVEVHIDGDATVEKVQANVTGDWQLVFDTGKVSQDSHTAKAKYNLLSGGRVTESNYGQLLKFYVGVSPTAVISSSDLNKDGKINLIDFSILIFWWGTAGGNSNPKADINGNGKVGLEDFSILLFNWTG